MYDPQKKGQYPVCMLPIRFRKQSEQVQSSGLTGSPNILANA